jgi:hypothetical protein
MLVAQSFKTPFGVQYLFAVSAYSSGALWEFSPFVSSWFI